MNTRKSAIFVPLFALAFMVAFPAQAKFLQTDPLGYEDQMNMYAYVHNDPVNMYDPDGRAARAIVGGFKIAKRGYEGYKKYGNLAQGLREGGKEFVRDLSQDWHALDADSTATPGEQFGAFVDLLLGTDIHESTIFNPDNTGKIKDTDFDPDSVGDDELDGAIGELDKSIERRNLENDRNPRGNPNSRDPNDRENAKNRKNHKIRIAKEQEWRKQLLERKNN